VRRYLLKQLRSVKFRFMDSGRQWHKTWPAQRNTGTGHMAFRQRPIAVEVTLELEDWGEIVRIIEVPV
jgi:general secretion pathway protein J